MTPTDELRRGLDERGIKWESHGEKYHTWYDLPHGGRVCVIENNAGYLHIKSDAITPTQAIAATVGAGTCKAECDVEYYECHMETFACKGCGWSGVVDNGKFGKSFGESSIPNFCPNCGRRIEVDE
jgi:hypothetical protein